MLPLTIEDSAHEKLDKNFKERTQTQTAMLALIIKHSASDR